MKRGAETFAVLYLATALSSAVTGCARAWRPPLTGVQVATVATIVDLSRRMPPPGVRLTYRRTSQLNPRAEPEHYVVQVTGTGQGEGKLLKQSRGSLASYLKKEGAEQAAQQFSWPNPWGVSAAGFFLEFDPPLITYPRALEGCRTSRHVARFTCHGVRGQRLYSGTVTRTITLEGYETVAIDDTSYHDCVRLRAQTWFRIPWIARVALTEYSWFAAGVGEVKRLRRWRGFFLLAYFEDIVRYELVSVERPTNQPAEEEEKNRAPERMWRCVVYLQPALPTPRLQGLVVEYGTP